MFLILTLCGVFSKIYYTISLSLGLKSFLRILYLLQIRSLESNSKNIEIHTIKNNSVGKSKKEKELLLCEIIFLCALFIFFVFICFFFYGHDGGGEKEKLNNIC